MSVGQIGVRRCRRSFIARRELVSRAAIYVSASSVTQCANASAAPANLAISPQTRVVAGVSVVNRGVHVRHEDVGLGDGVDSSVVADGGLGRDCLVEIIDNESEPNTGDDSTSKKDETYIELMRRAQDGPF